MDKDRKRELGQYIEAAYNKLKDHQHCPLGFSEIHDCLHEILNALSLIKSELGNRK
jgi:hypothetical protein